MHLFGFLLINCNLNIAFSVTKAYNNNKSVTQLKTFTVGSREDERVSVRVELWSNARAVQSAGSATRSARSGGREIDI